LREDDLGRKYEAKNLVTLSLSVRQRAGFKIVFVGKDITQGKNIEQEYGKVVFVFPMSHEMFYVLRAVLTIMIWSAD
jgi:hypothetical protein